MAYYVYILKSLSVERYYIGSTQDVQSRLQRHNQGRSKYTKPYRPWKLVYTEQFDSRSDAVRLEDLKARLKVATGSPSVL